jgi:Uma2 family endonuclease
MGSASTNSSMPKVPPLEVPARRVSTLDELQAMTAKPDHRVVIHGVDWAFYEELVALIPANEPVRVDYDGKDVEIVMVLSFPHDETKKLLGRFVELVAEVCEIPIKSGGQTTWMRREVNRGLESDDCYFFRAEKLAMIAAARARKPGKWSEDVANYPDPDLAIEVDISRPEIDRPGIYAALKVPEVWRFEDDQIFIDHRGEDGRYHDISESRFLPVKAGEIRRWVAEEDVSDESAWASRLRARARAELAGRRAP